MTLVAFSEAPLTREHDRAGFDCGDPELNDYLRRYARQNHASGGAKCFVAASPDTPHRIRGYYTLSPASLDYSRTPAIAKRGLGRYEVPVFRLGRLAVDQTSQSQGLGGALLVRAARRCMSVAQEVGGVALLIDAKHDRAALWYVGYGAVPLLDTPLSLILPFATVDDALTRADSR
jgi:GNAT superfamily N-acetyltransferase